MPNIIAAHFPDFDAAANARRFLELDGFPPIRSQTFYLNGPGDDDAWETEDHARLMASARPPGVVVAVHVPKAIEQDRAITVLGHCGAACIEEVDGRWEYGGWQDFDPVSVPHWVRAPHS